MADGKTAAQIATAVGHTNCGLLLAPEKPKNGKKNSILRWFKRAKPKAKR
jgi:hypothetical protein